MVRVAEIERAIGSVPGVTVLHRTSDPDHNRTVITFAGNADAVVEGAVSAARRAAELIDLTVQQGVHPRVGALDVLPFVPLAGATLEDCIFLAKRAGERIWNELQIPVYYYEAAANHPRRVNLENVRQGQFEGLREAVLSNPEKCPDVGGPALHPTAGAVIVGARKILIAYNINLNTPDVSIAKEIARAIRTSNGGLPGVKALGLLLATRNLAQVSMNLTDFECTPPHVVFAEVSRLAALRGVEIAESELIGLMPRKAVEMGFAAALKFPAFDSQCVIENQIDNR